jgi:hypothetical protein
LLRTLLPALVIAWAPTLASTHPAATPAQAALASVQGFFDAMAHHDQAAMRAWILPDGGMALMRKGKPVRLSLGDFVARIKPDGHRIAEVIHDPLVKVDNDVAMVWAPYRFMLDGKLHHCGTDAFSLVRMDGRWLIAAVADTSRETCQSG